MLVSRKLLNNYIDSTLSTKELADNLTLLGLEYNRIIPGAYATKVVVGEVISCEKMPGSDHLNICQVDVGTDIRQIICGASNIKKGIKVIVALPGCELKDGMIKESKLRGYDSHGMICALDELGVEDKSNDRGIAILSNELKNGEEALQALGLDDEIIEIELPSNRGDLYSILGLARTTKLFTNKDIKLPETSYIFHHIEDKINLNVNTNSCNYYEGRLIKNINIGETPIEIKNILLSSGIQSINNVVDIANYVMLEMGQPFHLYDYDKLNNNINVDILSNSKMIGLDGNLVEINNDIVINDGNNNLAIAGVIGSKDYSITNNTTNLFIEAAIFDPQQIRKTSHRIGQSESSLRFEKGLDKTTCHMALNRLCHLLEKYCNAETTDLTVIYDNIIYQPSNIKLEKGKISRILGIEINEEDIKEYFNKLEFKYTLNNGIYTIEVPYYRHDLKLDVDIIEEIIRIYGIDNLESKILETYTINKRNKMLQKIDIIKNLLRSMMLDEVNTYSLVAQNNIYNLNSIKLNKPLSDIRKYYRTSLIPSLIEVYDYNKKRKVENINIFEIANTYYKSNDNIQERKLLSILLSSSILKNSWEGINIPSDFYKLKGIIENIFKYIGLTNRYQFKDPSNKILHPYQGADIYLDNENIGFIGRIHPKVKKDKIYILEIDLSKILSKSIRDIKNKDISKYPSITVDLALVMDYDVKAIDIINTIKKATTKELIDINVFDVYYLDNKKQLAIKLIFNSLDHTLESDFIKSETDKILTKVEEKHKAILRQ